MWFLKNKAQILVISIFSVMIGGIIIFTTLLPVLGTIKGLRQTTNSYQALASSEAGLEIELYNQKVDLLGDSEYITITCDKSNVGNSEKANAPPGEEKERKRGEGHSTGHNKNCKIRKKIKFDIDITTSTSHNLVYLKLISTGKYEEFERILFTGFAIGKTNP